MIPVHKRKKMESISDENDIEMNTTTTTPLISSDVLECISFRPLEPKDRGQIQQLHEEWFPVSYKDEFYDELVLHRMVNSGQELVTCAAVYQSTCDADAGNVPPSLPITTPTTASQEDFALSSCQQDSIVACIVGSMVDASRLSSDTVDSLLSDRSRYKRLFYIMTLGTVKFAEKSNGSCPRRSRMWNPLFACDYVQHGRDSFL